MPLASNVSKSASNVAPLSSPDLVRCTASQYDSAWDFQMPLDACLA